MASVGSLCVVVVVVEGVLQRSAVRPALQRTMCMQAPLAPRLMQYPISTTSVLCRADYASSLTHPHGRSFSFFPRHAAVLGPLGSTLIALLNMCFKRLMLTAAGVGRRLCGLRCRTWRVSLGRNCGSEMCEAWVLSTSKAAKLKIGEEVWA